MAKISQKHLEVITETAVKTALEHLEKHKKEEEKKNYDRRLRNIKLLLRNYRSFIKHVDDVKLDIKELDEQLVLDDIDEYSIKTIKQSKEKTLILIRYIQKMMKVYKFMCEQSSNPEDLRRYQIIYDMYISEEKKTAEEIAQGHFLHRRTVYKEINKASETLSVLMFGADGIKVI